MPLINGQDVRKVLLEVIQEKNPRDANQMLQINDILPESAVRLGISRDNKKEQVLLTEWYDLFRTGYMAWGSNISNAQSPWCHVTIRGTQALENLNRDPSNPSGYLQHLDSKAKINDVSLSYLKEGLDCYVAGSFKAAAVMIGAASESAVLELRDITAAKIQAKGEKLPNGIDDWRIRTILTSLKTFFDSKKKHLDKSLKEGYEAYWAAYTQQIRAVRNEAGHPSSIEPITPDTVHASFLIFPELASLAQKLRNWVENDYQ
jgi:hypothetical protein